MSAKRTPKWYAARTSNHQGVIADERTGATIAVAYDKADAPLLAAAPALLEAVKRALRIELATLTDYREHEESAVNIEACQQNIREYELAIQLAEGQ